jgi:hypothetical protein
VISQFKGLKRAIKYGDWEMAAKECVFKVPAGVDGVRKRNEKRADMFLSI